MVFQTILRELYRKILFHRCIPLEERELASSAIVFAPHPDDETLGCGGTIALKKRAGADLRIVFLTDGASSHSGRISRESLKEIRAQEAVSASGELGVAEADVLLLGLEDGKLRQQSVQAEEIVKQILTRYRPDEIYIPYHRETPADHRAASCIVLSVLEQCRYPTFVNEYPIWFWQHWPWTAPPNPHQNLLTSLKISLKHDLGGLLKDFKHCFTIAPVLDRKHAALAKHRSQTTRIHLDPGWKILSEVSGGAFLACFFQEREIFHRYHFAFRQ